MRTGLLAAFLALVLASAALAQNRPAQRPPVPPPAPAEPVPEPPLPYEPQLLRLAEVVGSVAYLRALCARTDAAAWRERMEALLEAEGRSPPRRERLTGAYNRGYRAYALTHRACAQASEAAAQRLAAEGEKLARTLAGRYGG